MFASFLGFLFIFYYLRIVKKPTLYIKNGKFRQFLETNLPLLREKYWPTLWCFGTHFQTALADTLRGTIPDLKYKRELITLEDGGQVSLDWYCPDSKAFEDDRKPVALFMPGLTGHSNTRYLKSLIPHAHSLGYKAVGFNNRARGGMKLLTPKLYCAANCEDVRYVVEHIKRTHPQSKIIAIGVSLGGILLCRYLAESGDDSLVDAAMLISVCYDLCAGNDSMSQYGLNMALNQHLTKSLVNIIKDQYDMLKDLDKIDYNQVISAKNLQEFDEFFTIKMWNFKSTDEYYKESSNKGRLSKIKRPTLCINAADDMFAPMHSLPIDEAEKSSHLALLVTDKGGHIGFIEGLLPSPPFYSERLVLQYLEALRKVPDLKDL